MIIYLDVVFLENFVINYFLIYITSKVLHIKCEVLYFIVAALIASIYTIVAIMYPLNLYKTFLFKLILVICIIKIAYRQNKVSGLIKSVLGFYAITFIFGGIVLAEVSKNANHMQMVTAIIGGTMLIITSWKLFLDAVQRKNSICDIVIEFDEEYCKVKALIDTGHTLKETITGDNVIIISKHAFETFIKKDLQDVLDGKEFDIPLKYQSKIRLITYKTVGNMERTVCGIKIDSVTIYYDGRKIVNKNVVVIKEEKEFNNYQALISLDLIEGGYVYGNNVTYKIKSKKAVC